MTNNNTTQTPEERLPSFLHLTMARAIVRALRTAGFDASVQTETTVLRNSYHRVKTSASEDTVLMVYNAIWMGATRRGG